MTRIVVGVDGSENAAAALAWAVAEGRRRGATVEAVHAWHEPVVGGTAAGLVPVPIDSTAFEEGSRQQLDQAIADAVDDETGVDLQRVLVHGTPARSLLERAEGADMLVVGRRGHGGFMGLLLGSVSQQVVWHAPCPVVVVPPAE